MSKLKASHFVIYVLARIHGPGFIDMFRYMNCVPATEAEAHAIEKSLGDGQSRWIVLKRFVMAGGPPLGNWERWASFNIPVADRYFEDLNGAETHRKSLTLSGSSR